MKSFRSRMDVRTPHLPSLHSSNQFTSQSDLLNGYWTSMASRQPPPWPRCLPREAKNQARGQHIVERIRLPLHKSLSHVYRVDLLFPSSKTDSRQSMPPHPATLYWEGSIDARWPITVGGSRDPDLHGILCSVCGRNVNPVSLSPILFMTLFPPLLSLGHLPSDHDPKPAQTLTWFDSVWNPEVSFLGNFC